MSTVSSDWGDWLPADIAAAEPDGLAIWYLGCNGLAVKAADGTTLFIDPYLDIGDPPRTTRMIPIPFEPTDVRTADALLGTHEHTDHVDETSQAPLLERTGALCYAPTASIEKIRDEGWQERWTIAADQLVSVRPGDTVDIGGIEVTVTDAHDPDAEEPVGYVLEYGDRTLFHAGDARPSEAFSSVGERFDIDLGVVAFGSAGMIPDKETGELRRRQWYNDENEIVECARDLQLDRLLPTHWDMWRGLTADPTVLHHHIASYNYPESLEIAQIGDRIEV